MIDKEDIQNIKTIVEEFFEKMTINVLETEITFSADIVNIDIKPEEPQILIGENGQTLFEIQRLLKTVLNKKTEKLFYLNLDINDYKKKKTEYLKDLANNLADQVALIKEEKILFPMPSYERRIIHAELSQRTGIVTESQGEGQDRHIIIKPR